MGALWLWTFCHLFIGLFQIFHLAECEYFWVMIGKIDAHLEIGAPVLLVLCELTVYCCAQQVCNCYLFIKNMSLI